MNPLHKRIFEISYHNKLSHIGSCISAVGIIDDIYSIKSEENPFILSAGHSALALYCVLEKKYGFDAEALYKKHGVHPNKDAGDKICCSTGSLGQGITVAVGMAIADRKRDVYCLTTDGECQEGSVFEALNFCRENQLNNLKLYCNFNGFTALSPINRYEFSDVISSIWDKSIIVNTRSIVENYPFLCGLSAHYHVLTDKDWDLIKNA